MRIIAGKNRGIKLNTLEDRFEPVDVEYTIKEREQDLLDALESSEEDSKKVKICKKRIEMGKIHKLDMESLYIIHKRFVICTPSNPRQTALRNRLTG